MFNNIHDWRLEDSYPAIPLLEIASIPERIHSLIVRNKTHPVVSGNFLRIIGAWEMTVGIQYHHDRFMETIHKLAELHLFSPETPPLRHALSHESVAYVNRVGQLWYFSQSDFVLGNIGDAGISMPTFETINIFRNKHAAHRSIDAPRANDTIYLQEQHAATLTKFTGILGEPKIKVVPVQLPNVEEDHIKTQRHFLKNYVVNQVQSDDGRVVHFFSVERDHPKVMTEAWALFQALYK